MFFRKRSSAISATRYQSCNTWRTMISFPLISVTESSPVTTDSLVQKLFEDLYHILMIRLIGIQKNLQYWIAIAEGRDATYNGLQFKSKEPKPLIHGDGRLEFKPDLSTKLVIPPELLSKICILLSVRYHLSVFLDKVHKELMIIRKRWSSTENLLAQHIATLERYISELKDSVHSIANLDPINSDKPTSNEKPGDAVNRIYRNLDKMDMYFSSLVDKYHRPSKLLQNWVSYAVGGTIAVAALSTCIYNQSGPLGIMGNTFAGVKDFVIDNVKEPLTHLKDELINKSMKRDMALMEIDEVRSTDERLGRMLLDFFQPTTNYKAYTNLSNSERIELLDESYAEQIKFPIHGILRGNLVQACFIQIQKLKLDLLTEKLLMNKIMRANGLTLAIVAASPTIGVFSLGGLVIHKLVKRSELKDKLASRRILQQIEWRVNDLQREDGHEESMRGLLLYALDQLYKVTEKRAKATYEWERKSG